ncbi:MAG TPA: glycosyltransferase family 2 protein [Candidatus Sulfotelmatobacter sp.]|nr:glycosyltransferase family 2 protein [Candidatus Sulfotelmatobacter sp.]
MLSVVIPARNEEATVEPTLTELAERLDAERIPFEIIVVNDHSTDATAAVVSRVGKRWPQVRCIDNPRANGFGNAIHSGLDAFAGEAVCIVMADASDDPGDVVAYWRAIEAGFDCAFGSRFMRGANVVEYPWLKLALNRIANLFVAALMGISYNDVTNAFKCYRREVIDGVRPILAHHFNITVELPLKAIVRGYSWTVVPTSWYNRKGGVSKFKIKEMGSRYLFIVLYALLEKWLSRGDYRRRLPLDVPAAPAAPPAAVRATPPKKGPMTLATFLRKYPIETAIAAVFVVLLCGAVVYPQLRGSVPAAPAAAPPAAGPQAAAVALHGPPSLAGLHEHWGKAPFSLDSAVQGSSSVVVIGKHQPVNLGFSASQPLSFTGWAFDDGQPSAGVYLLIDGSRRIAALYGVDRPDVARVLNAPKARYVGYIGTIPAKTLSPGVHSVAILVVAHDDKGYFTEGSPVRFTVTE